MSVNAGAGRRMELLSAPIAGVLTLLNGQGRREKTKMLNAGDLLGDPSFCWEKIFVVVWQHGDLLGRTAQ